ncbi:MAG: hypothetical protein GTO41_28010, partial [Burkholderiales bacterium]|nr:hypothetical protein [Burkholderiales bacterium]
EAFAGYATARLLWHQPWLRFLAGWPMRCLAGLARARDSAGGTFARRVHWVSQVFSKRRGNYVFDPVG